MFSTNELRNLADWELINIKDTCWEILEERRQEEKKACIKKFEDAFNNLKEHNISLLVCDDYVRFEDFTFD